MEYYTAMIIKKLKLKAISWTNFRNIMFSERSQTQNSSYSTIPLIQIQNRQKLKHSIGSQDICYTWAASDFKG